MSNCLTCIKETTNPKFCSKSCAAKYNNKKFPKRKPENKCKKCFAPITSSKRICEKCRESSITYNWSNKTLGEVMNLDARHPSWTYGRVRGFARNYFFKHNSSPKCKFCGYDKHIEVCHLKPIHSFSPDSLLSEINSLSNLIGLCRNCHWELDHKLLDFPEFDDLHL